MIAQHCGKAVDLAGDSRATAGTGSASRMLPPENECPCMPERQVILLVEDNEDDIFFMQRALEKAGVAGLLQVARNGQQALDYLAGHEAYADRAQFPVPHLVFLDLKLPHVPGFEVLSWMRAQPSLRNIPVVVLTSSPQERDREKAHELGAEGYLIKPPTRETVREATRCLREPDGCAPGPSAG